MMPGAIRHPATASMEDADDAELAKPIPGKSTGMRKPPVVNDDEEDEETEDNEQVENGPVGSVLAGAAIGAAGGYAMNPTAAGALKGSTIGIGAGLAHGIASSRVAAKKRRKKLPEGVTNSTQESEMNLKPEERAELVSNLTTNCDCWKYEGSDGVLNAMPDEQLVTVYNQAKALEDIVPVINQIAEDFGVDQSVTLDRLPQTLIANAVAAFDGSGEGGGEGDTRANGEGDDPDADYNDDGLEGEEEGEYDGDNQEQGSTMISDPQTKGKGVVKNQRRKPMTTNQWLATAPPDVQVVVRNALRRDAEEKEKLIETITSNANNEFSDEELLAMNTDQLRPIAKLASVTRNRAAAPKKNGHNRAANYFGIQGAAAPVFNEVNDEDLLEVPTMNQEDWAQNAKDTRN